MDGRRVGRISKNRETDRRLCSNQGTVVLKMN